MPTPAQLATIKTDVLADPVLSLLAPSADNAFAIALAYQAIVNPSWYVFRTNVAKNEVMNFIVWANMTPAQGISASGDAIHIWNAKALQTATKQMNLQNLLLTEMAINFALSNVRAGFQDALTGLPTKNDGTNQQAGWTALQLVISRAANRLEKLLSTGIGSQAMPATMAHEGTVSYTQIQQAMGWQ